MELLKVENISYSYKNRYQQVAAVKNVSCSFERGRCYAIVGKSGSGKTTLLSLLAGLELPDEGQVLFDGKPTVELDCDAYRLDHAAVIYQGYNLFPLLTAFENVMFPLKLKKTCKAEAVSRAERALESVGISRDKFNRYPSRLSGGEQQRVAIARAVAAENDVILADEPTGNLDISSGDQVVKLLLKLSHEENRCVIVITHDLEIAAQMDEIYMMRDGRLERGESEV